MSELKKNKETLAQLICAFNTKGWSPATSTNYSLRETPVSQTFWVSKSGLDKAHFTVNDFMEVDFIGNPTNAFKGIVPSAETLIHCAIYQLFPDTTCVLHSHSLDSVVLSSLLKDKLVVEGYEIQKALKAQTTHDAKIEIPVFENTQDIAAFSQLLTKKTALLAQQIFIMKKHGSYTWGSSIAEAKRYLEALEYLISSELKLQSLNK
jgi:methylthioribulose-1-phosphate dehydratase